MIRKIFYGFLLLVLPLSTYAQKKLTPLEFNDRLSSITDTLYLLGQKWGEKLKEVSDSKEYSQLKDTRLGLEKYIDGQIAFLQKMPDVKNSKELRMGMIGFLQFEKGMAETGFRPLEKLTATSTASELSAILEGLTTESKKESAELEKIAALQEAYGKANGFKIEAAQEPAK